MNCNDPLVDYQHVKYAPVLSLKVNASIDRIVKVEKLIEQTIYSSDIVVKSNQQKSMHRTFADYFSLFRDYFEPDFPSRMWSKNAE